MADTAIRVRAGQSVSATYTPASTDGTWTAYATDAAGRRMTAAAEVSGTDIAVTINKDQWQDGRPGIGRMQLKRAYNGETTYPKVWTLRILPGIDAYGEADGYLA